MARTIRKIVNEGISIKTEFTIMAKAITHIRHPTPQPSREPGSKSFFASGHTRYIKKIVRTACITINMGKALMNYLQPDLLPLRARLNGVVISYRNYIPLEIHREDLGNSVLKQSAYLYVCGTLDALKGGVDRSTETSDRRNSRYGVPFSLDHCDQNVTGMCPLQSITVFSGHLRVGSVCVSG